MNLKQLEVFIAVAETKSFTNGAEKCFLTQSTVSQHISSLEVEFGVKLFDRTGKGAFLTEGGKIFFNFASRIFTAKAEMIKAMHEFTGMEATILRIGGSNIPSTYLIPKFLPLFQNCHQGVLVQLVQGTSNEIVEKLAGEIVELGIVGDIYDNEQLDFHPLCRDKIVLVVSASHPWTSKEKIDLEEILEASFVFRGEGSGTDSTVRKALECAGVDLGKLNVTARLGSNEAIKQAVIEGIGISFISEMSMKQEQIRGELCQVKIEDLSISRTFFLATRRGRELSPAAASFSSTIVKWIQQSPYYC